MTEGMRRTLLALHVAYAAPLVAPAAWFGLVDRLPFGEGRCASCGVEGYVIAAHVAAAAWLGAVVAVAAAARRAAREGVAALGRVTVRALAAVAAFVVAALLWHPLAAPPAFAAMLASIVTFPFAVVWWPLAALLLVRRPPTTATAAELDRALAAAWVSLTVLLPALFAWVWADRVEWLVF
jgi:hypothetical protein